MQQQIKFPLSINWVDGMKMNKDHFIAFEKSLKEHIRYSTHVHLTPHNYGLLPVVAMDDPPVQLALSLDGQQSVTLHIIYCRAVTPGGEVIYIDQKINPWLMPSGYQAQTSHILNDTKSDYYVVVSVDPTIRVPVGDADPSEEPSRIPYVLPKYQVEVIPESAMGNTGLGRHHITLGKITFEDDLPVLVEDFIPPCHSVQSHEKLLHTYTEIGVFFERIEGYAVQIVQKVFRKQQQHELAEMILYISQQIIQYMTSTMASYRIKDRNEPPIEIILKLMNLARVINTSIEVYAGTGKEQLISYLSNWSNQKQGALEATLQDTINLEYRHYDINAFFSAVSPFIQMTTSIFEQVSKLEFIGKKSDSQIFVTEAKISEEDGTKKRRDLFAD